MWNIRRSLLDFCEEISEYSWAIRYVLKIPRAMAAIELPRAMNDFGLPGIKSSIDGKSALIMSLKSFNLYAFCHQTYVICRFGDG